MALRAGRVGINQADVDPIDGHIKGFKQSRDAVQVGITDDGIPIYQITIKTKSPATTGDWVVISDLIDSTKKIIRVDGVVHGNNYLPINFESVSTSVATYIASDGIRMRVTGDGMTEKDVYITLQYFETEEN